MDFASRANAGVIGPWDFMPGGPEQFLRQAVPEAFPDWQGPTPSNDERQLSRHTGWGQDVGAGQEVREYGDEEEPLSWAYNALGVGEAWVPPVRPEDVVGTGHKWLDPVSMEGAHKGLDLQLYQGKPALSPVNGQVSTVEFDPAGLGLQVSVQNPQGEQHKLSHLLDTTVAPGQAVGAGEQIARVGSTGAGSTGPHLDYRIQDAAGNYVNPEPRLGELAQLPRADNGREPGQGQDGGGGGRVGWGQDVGVGGYYDEYGDYIEDESDWGGGEEPWVPEDGGGEEPWATNPYTEPFNPYGTYNPYGEDEEPAPEPFPNPYTDPFNPYGTYNPYGGGGGTSPYVDPFDVPDDYRNLGDIGSTPGYWDQNPGWNTQPTTPNRNPNPNPNPYPNPYPESPATNVPTDTSLGNPYYTNRLKEPTSSMGGGYGPSGSPPSGGATYGQPRPGGSSSSGSNSQYDAQQLALAQQELTQRQQDAAGRHQEVMDRLAFDRQVHGDSMDLRTQEMAEQRRYNEERLQFDRDQLGISTALKTVEIDNNWQQHRDDDQRMRELAALDDANAKARLGLDGAELDHRMTQDLARLEFDRQAHGDSLELDNRRLAMEDAYNNSRMAIDQQRMALDAMLGMADIDYKNMRMGLDRELGMADIQYKQQRMALDEQLGRADIALKEGQLEIARGQLQAQIDQNEKDYQLGLSKLQQDYAIHQDDDRFRREQMALDNQFRQADMQLKKDMQAIDIQAQKDIQGTFAQRAAEDRFQSALRNPWVQQLTGMAPVWGAPGGPGGTAANGTAANTWGVTPPSQAWLPPAPGTEAATGQQLGGTPTGPAAENAATTTPAAAPAPWTPAGAPTFAQYQTMTPYERAAMRVQSEVAGVPWEATAQNMRQAWGQNEGVFTAPDTSQLGAATQTATQQIGTEQVAETFGQTAPQYWQEQQRTWSQAAAPQVAQTA
jgi:Peptidase family M23